MDFRVLYQAGDWPSVRYVFQDRSAYEEWAKIVENIKNEIERINNQIEAEGRAGAGTLSDYQRWILLVEGMVIRYTKDYVPADIRWALNDVEAKLGLAATVWPTMVDVFWVT